MQKKLWFLILSFITIGCTEKVYVMGPTTTKTDTLIVGGSVGQTLNLRVDWSKFTQSSLFDKNGFNDSKLSSQGPQIVMIGSRLVYPREKAVFTQAVERTLTDSQPKLITLQVPPTDSAHLYVIAIAKDCPTDCGRLFAMKLGVKRSIKISPNTTINLTLDSLTLVDAGWVVDATETGYSVSNDTIFTTRSIADTTVYNHLKIRVTDPFESGAYSHPSGATIVGFDGIGRNTANNPSGMRLMTIDLNNRITVFWPGVNGMLFGFSPPFTNLFFGKKGVVVTTFTP